MTLNIKAAPMNLGIQSAPVSTVTLDGVTGSGQPVHVNLSGVNSVALDPMATWQSWSVGPSAFMTVSGGGRTFYQKGPASGLFPATSWNTGYDKLAVSA